MDAFSIALAHHRQGRLAEAAASYRVLLADAPDNDDAWGNLGLALMRLGREAEALPALERACALRPDKPQHAYNRGNLLWRLRRLPEAAEAYARAHARRPDLPGLVINYANVLLALGDWAKGWALYDQRPERLGSAAHALPFPEWQGQDLPGRRLFVWGEQGLGDQILAARFFARTGAAQVTVAAAAPLTRLFAQMPVTVVPRLGDVSVAPHDFWSQPLSLPRWLSPGELWTGPYLTGSPRRDGGLGVVWKGNPTPDPGRSLPEEMGRRLLALPGAVSLHPDDSGARDFQDTADLVAGLDAVVTIDTSVAHLAGAMGKPTWLLLQHHAADWRWEQPWHPTAQIFRQPTPGDWASVVEAVTSRWEARG